MARRPTKAERRRQILETARRVFGRKGYAATRMIDIAAEAKVGKGTLYQYFSSKEELLASLVLAVMTESLETLQSTTEWEDPERALADTITYMVQVALVDHLDLYRLFYDFWGVSAETRLVTQERVREVGTSFRRMLSDAVRRGQESGVFRPEVDPDLFAHALCASVDGLSLQIVIAGEQIDLDGYARHLREVFLGGLRAAGSLGGASVLKERK